MTSDGDDTIDPFDDPALPSDHPDPITIDTLVLGRDVSLTLGPDSLIVLDEALAQQPRRSCCGLIPISKPGPTRTIPIYNILWAELWENTISITHAQPISSTVVRPSVLSYPIEKPNSTEASTFIERLLARAYGQSQRKKRIKVLINPFGGSGSAQKYYSRDIEPILKGAQCELHVERTQYSGHAVEIAEKLNADAFDVVASCSGDGLPYEVFNGLGKKPDAARALAKLAVVQLPCGTGNAMSLNLSGTDSPSLAALAIVKGIRTPLDLVSITQGDRRTLSFLSQSLGIVAESDLATENLRWMGDARFTFGFLVRLLGKTVWPCDIALKVVEDSKPAIKERHRAFVSTGDGDGKTQSSYSDNYTTSASRSFNSPKRVRASSSAAVPSTNNGNSNSSEGTSSTSPGLPPLTFGTINDPLPSDWHLTPYPTLGNFYAGNMGFMSRDANFFQAALPSDGCLDLVMMDGCMSRLRAFQSMLAVGSGEFFDMPEVEYRKVAGYRVIPRVGKQTAGWAKWLGRGKRGRRKADGAGEDKNEGYISVDGERIPFEPFQVEVHRALGTVLSRGGRGYEHPPL